MSVAKDWKMRVLMLNDYGRPNGGAELQMLALRDGLLRRGHEVRLLTSDAELTPGFPLLADRTCRGRNDIVQVLTQTANRSAARALAQELRAYPPDVVHVRMFLTQLSPLILPQLRDVPVLFQAAIYKAICPNGLKLLPDGTACTKLAGRVCLTSGCVAWKTWTAAMAQLAMVRRWRGAIDVSAVLSRRMAEEFSAAGWPDVTVLPNGVDEAAPRPPLTADPMVAYAGRLSREKGVDTLIASFARMADRVPEARLVIAGAGPLESELRAAAAPLGARVRFMGHLAREDMESLFSQAWVQAVPSLWHEPFGNVSTEAMMRGTAVIASDMGGQSDIVRDGETGYLVPPGDVSAWATALERVLADRPLAERLGAAGRAVALRDYSRESALDRTEAAYRAARARFMAKDTLRT